MGLRGMVIPPQHTSIGNIMKKQFLDNAWRPTKGIARFNGWLCALGGTSAPRT